MATISIVKTSQYIRFESKNNVLKLLPIAPFEIEKTNDNIIIQSSYFEPISFKYEIGMKVQNFATTDSMDFIERLAALSPIITNYNEIIDPMSGSIITIDYPHSEAHCGCQYYLSDWIGLGAGGGISFLFKTPISSKLSHLIFEYGVDGETTFEIFENPTLLTNGASITPINRNRNSSNPAEMQTFQFPTWSSVGSKIYDSKISSGRDLIGTNRADNEIILKQNLNYLIVATNVILQGSYFSYLFDWYEH